MNCEDLISIIVPVYNIEEYLEKCIESIIAQTYRNLQIVLVDDGSTDRSRLICDRYASVDNRIIVLHKENGGLVSARKAGLKVALGEYIGFVDGDDYIEPEMFELLYKVIVERNADFAHSGYKKNEDNYIYSVSNFSVFSMNQEEKIDFYKNNVFDSTCSQYIFPSIWSKLFKKELILKAYMSIPESQSYGEDLLALCNCVYYSKTMVVMDDGYYHYRIRDNSLSRNKDAKTLINEYKLYDALCNLFGDLDILPEIIEILQKFLVKNAANSIAYITGKSVEQYSYPNIQELFDKRIVIFGAGKVGRDFYSQISRYRRCKVVGWVDNNYSNYSYDFYEVQKVDSILNLHYDVVVIAVMMESVAREIKEELECIGIESKKITWISPMSIMD